MVDARLRLALVRHVPALDGLRAIAILLVLGAHAGWLPGGTLGVDLFFVLSGFLITSVLLSEYRAGSVSLRGFYVRRAARLLPGLWLLLAAYVAYAVIGHGAVGTPTHIAGAALIGFTYVANFFAATWSPDQARYLMHLWSLAQEEQFYLVWPVVLIWLLRRCTDPRRVLTVLGAIVVAVTVERWVLLEFGASTFRISFAPDTNIDSLCIGCAAALLWAHHPGLRVDRRVVALAVGYVLFAVMVVPRLVEPERAHILTVASPVYPIASAAIIVAAATGSAVARALSPRPLRYLGRISYGVYLWHFPLMHFAGVPAGLVLTALVAPLSYRYLESPIRKFGRRIASESGGAGLPEGDRTRTRAAVSAVRG
jgi:peptidoglycan/LPS O-acetylase OafA/YrhL